MTTYDLDLFRALNEEYRDKPLVPAAPRYDAESLRQRGEKRAADIMAVMGQPGRVLEIGCGHGEVSRTLAATYGCTAVGIEVSDYPGWDVVTPGATLLKHDLAQAPLVDQAPFDLIYSNSVFEHVVHPFSMLKAARDHLRPGGRMILNINLYRGPKASHRYADVFFPWPHILFTDEVFNAYFAEIGRPTTGAEWVNQLSIADYFRYFDMLGLDRVVTRFSKTPLDRPFYERFADQLERFPVYDLERDFLRVQLIKPETPLSDGFIEHNVLLRERRATQDRLAATQDRVAVLQERLAGMQARVAAAQDRAAAFKARAEAQADRVAEVTRQRDRLKAANDRTAQALSDLRRTTTPAPAAPAAAPQGLVRRVVRRLRRALGLGA